MIGVGSDHVLRDFDLIHINQGREWETTSTVRRELNSWQGVMSRPMDRWTSVPPRRRPGRGLKHFTSEAEARSYSEKIVAEQSRSSNGLKKSNGDGGSKVLPTGGVSGYEGSPYAKWVSVQDQAIDVDGDVKADSDELGLTKLTDPEDPMTKPVITSCGSWVAWTWMGL